MTGARESGPGPVHAPATILISVLPGELRAACLRAGILEDLLILRADRPRLLGNIYRGRVLELSPGLDAAFVDIGLPRPGFLPRGEAPGKKQLGRALSNGDAVTVRVVREIDETKGVRLSARITHPPAGLDALAAAAPVPSLLAAGDDPLLRLIARQSDIEAIVVDDSATSKSLKTKLAGQDFPEDFPEDAPEQGKGDALVVTFDPALRPLFEREGAEEQIEALLDPRVELPGGGSLLIEPVRTLTAIDVNLGAMAASGSAQAQALSVNLEAVPEIARQLRLRSIAGLIVVDFLELKDRKARDRLIAELRTALTDDGEPCQIVGMSSSGLLEMTRRRGGPTLAETLSVPAGEHGSGFRRDAVTLAFEALRRARSEADAAPGCEIVIKAPRSVLAALRDGAAARARQTVDGRLGQALRLELARDPQHENLSAKDAETAGGAVEVLAVRR
jgi:Ribonuclease G/E